MSAMAGRKGLLVTVLGALFACQSASPTRQQGNQGNTTATGDSGSGGGSGNDTGTGASVTTQSGGNGSTTTPGQNGGATNPTSSGAAAGSGVTSVATGGAPAVSKRIVLTKASARIGGRRGDSLVVDVEGTAPLGAFASIEIALADASGAPVPFFDNNWDGKMDSATGRVVPSKLPTATAFSLEAQVEGVKKLNGISELQVALFDRDNARTEPIAVVIQQQPIVELGGGCDPKFVTNRCREGLSCTGTPTTCADGTAPTIAHAAYQRGAEGPLMRVDGVDPDEDVIIVRVDFLTSTDTPVLLDLDGDDVPEADHLEVTDGISNQNGGYVFAIESGTGFDALVPRIGLTTIDSKGNESASQRVSISNRVVRTSGQSCDLPGFVGCPTGTVCLPSTATATTGNCSTYSQVETTRCASALAWDLSKDSPKITGLITGYSAWEPPAGCLSSTATNRPEAVIKLHLAAATPRLVLSTSEGETQIDTGIVVLPTCTASADSAIACNDDSVGYASSVTLTNLAAGDYFVIIESVGSNSGSFGLSAKTQ